LAKDLVEADERCGGIAAAAPETGCEWDAFFQMHRDAIVDICGLEKYFGGAIDKIAGISWQTWIAASELDSAASALKCETVIDGHWMHDRFEFVKTVGPLAEDVQQQIDLTRRLFFERHA
jgi:hypothetical protein